MTSEEAAGPSPAQRKWDRVYEQKQVGEDGHPGVLDDAAHLLPGRGRALDLACGTGAASLVLARRGLEVTAWDISPVAIGKLSGYAAQRGLPIRAEVVDIEHTPMPRAAFDVIVVARYLERSLCAALSEALRPGGLLAYQTFSIEATASAAHMNPAYCLVRGELLGLFHDLQVLFYREDALVGDASRGIRNEARLIAQKRLALPDFFHEWVRGVTDGDDPAALSRAIARFRRRLAGLDDAVAPGAQTSTADALDRIETADAVVVADLQAPVLRALVLPKGEFVLPTDLPETALRRLGRTVDLVAGALRQTAGAGLRRSFIPHPSDCRTRRLHVIVESDSRADDEETRRALWRAAAARIRDGLQAEGGGA